MEREMAIKMFPTWAKEPTRNEQPAKPGRMQMQQKLERAKKRYGLTVIAILGVVIWSLILTGVTEARTEKRVRQEMAIEYAAQLEQYKQEQAQAAQAEHWLSGEASREAAVNQEIDAVAMVIARLGTDQQKLTEACCMLARVMSANYPNSFEEVATQDQQWMFFDGSNRTFSEHDRALAEQIVRPYMEQGIVPNGLTADFVYGEWSTTDFVLRDSWERNSKANYWRYQG